MFEPPGGVGPHVYQNGLPPYQKALDNVRALSIAAFWLPDLSWKLSGHAVRIATELNVHQSFRKALMKTPVGSKLPEAERMRRDQERKFHYERARLWYLLYVCDHHFSIAYGRPPVICYSQHEAIRNEGYELYLESDLCKEGDFRVVSQMALFVVLERIYECFAGEISEGGMVREEVLFGCDSTETTVHAVRDIEAQHREDDLDEKGNEDETLVNADGEDADTKITGRKRKLESVKDNRKKKRKSKVGKVEEFCRDLEEWRDNWCVRLRKNAFVGDYPAKGVMLHYHFAKLQLHSLALRGVTGLATNEISSADIISNFSPQRIAMARVAIESARHVLTTILTVEEIRICLIGVPLYVHTMIAFAAVFLMKVTSRWRNVAGIGDLVNPTDDVWNLVEKVVEVLKDVAGGSITQVVPKDGKGKGTKKGPATDGPSLKGAGEMHIVWYIAGGLEKMAKKCRALMQNEHEEDENDRTRSHARGRWETVWQDSGKTMPGSEGSGTTTRERHESMDVSVAPGVGGPGVTHPVEPKREEDYHGSWNTQSQPNAYAERHPSISSYHGGSDASPHISGQDQTSNLQSYPYSSSGPSETQAVYTFNHNNAQCQDGHQHANHDDMSFDPTNNQIYNFPGLTPYEFFPDGTNGSPGMPHLNGGGYFSFAGFDLFGGGTMEAIPMAGAVGCPSRSESIAGMGVGPYPQYLHPPGPTGGQHSH